MRSPFDSTELWTSGVLRPDVHAHHDALTELTAPTAPGDLPEPPSTKRSLEHTTDQGRARAPS